MCFVCVGMCCIVGCVSVAVGALAVVWWQKKDVPRENLSPLRF